VRLTSLFVTLISLLDPITDFSAFATALNSFLVYARTFEGLSNLRIQSRLHFLIFASVRYHQQN
jgi:hypothetical protein